MLLEEQEFWWFVFSTTLTNPSPIKDLQITYLCLYTHTCNFKMQYVLKMISYIWFLDMELKKKGEEKITTLKHFKRYGRE